GENSPNQQTLGTEVTGTVTEQPRDDGRALVTIDMQTTNAMSLIVQGPDLTRSPSVGYQAPELVDGVNQAALGDAHLHLVFVNSAPGASLPDLNQLVMAPQPGQELLDLQFKYDGHGTWRDNGNVPVHIMAFTNEPFRLM